MFSLIEEHYLQNYSNLIKRFKRRAGTEWDAEDVVQEAYYRALKYSHTFVGGMNLQHWFTRIIINVLKDHYDVQNNMSCIEFDEELIEPEYTNLPVGEANKLLREEIEAVDNPEHKEVLSLYFTYGFRMKEIDQIVEMKYRNIDLVIQRFRRMLKEKHN
jgi:RNA polymerase sigma factor (sigma-70 family)